MNNGTPVLSLHGVVVVLTILSAVTLALAKRITGVEALSVISGLGGVSVVVGGTAVVVRAVRSPKS